MGVSHTGKQSAFCKNKDLGFKTSLCEGCFTLPKYCVVLSDEAKWTQGPCPQSLHTHTLTDWDDTSPECQHIIRAWPRWMLVLIKTGQLKHLLDQCFLNCAPWNPSGGAKRETRGRGKEESLLRAPESRFV